MIRYESCPSANQVSQMAIQAVDVWLQRLVPGLTALAICGCLWDPPAGVSGPQIAAESKSPSDQDRLEGETTTIHSGAQGDLVLSHGSVVTADGIACPRAVVVLDQDVEGRARRCLTVQSDAQGSFTIRGDAASNASNMVWAATQEGGLGMTWNSDEPVTIRLLGGTTRLHVRTSEGSPVENVVVTVYQGSIDDISEVVPSNLRKFVRRITDQDGVVEFPSSFGYYDIGFQIRASGHPVTMRDSYSSLDNNLFVLDRADEYRASLAKSIEPENFSDLPNDRRINFGSPASLPPCLDYSTRRAQP